MNRQAVKWATEAIVLVGLAAFVARSAIRLNDMETETTKVSGIEYDIRVICITLKLLAPEKYRQAEELAK